MLEPVHGPAPWFPSSLSPSFWLSDRSRLPSRIVRAACRATSLALRVRRARPPSPPFCGEAPYACFASGLRARVGRGPLATPVHSTDVCNSRFVFQRNDCSTPRCTPRRVSPRDAGLLGSRRVTRFSEATGPFGELSSPIAPAARTSDAPSLRGLPGRARLRPPASARRSSCDDPRVVPESLGFLHQAA